MIVEAANLLALVLLAVAGVIMALTLLDWLATKNTLDVRKRIVATLFPILILLPYWHPEKRRQKIRKRGWVTTACVMTAIGIYILSKTFS